MFVKLSASVVGSVASSITERNISGLVNAFPCMLSRTPFAPLKHWLTDLFIDAAVSVTVQPVTKDQLEPPLVEYCTERLHVSVVVLVINAEMCHQNTAATTSSVALAFVTFFAADIEMLRLEPVTS